MAFERQGQNLNISVKSRTGAPLAPPQTVPWAQTKDATLSIETTPGTGMDIGTQLAHNGISRIGTLQLSLDGTALGEATPIPLEKGGTKIGVTPLRNGAPLGAIAPRQISLSSGTFERDGNAIIGVNITRVTEQIARENGLPDAVGAIVDNVEANSPARKAGVQVGDVVVGVNGQNVVDVETMKAAVGAVKPGAQIKLDLLRARRDGSGIDWENALATTDAMLDYNFTTAPTDWRAARGRWEVTERWTCSPQWSFFGGGQLGRAAFMEPLCDRRRLDVGGVSGDADGFDAQRAFAGRSQHRRRRRRPRFGERLLIRLWHGRAQDQHHLARRYRRPKKAVRAAAGRGRDASGLVLRASGEAANRQKRQFSLERQRARNRQLYRR